MKIINSTPIWGETLAPGYCGFIAREKNIVGDGIEWFERWENGLPFVHTFVVDSAMPHLQSAISIIESHAQTGVSCASLSQYLGQKDCQCFIRIPVGYTEQIGEKIVAAAARHIGEKYGFGLIVADALINSYLGHLINYLTANVPDKIVCELFTDRHHKICSQLVALALQSQIYLRLRGCLRQPADSLLPRELGNDPQIWDPCIYRIS